MTQALNADCKLGKAESKLVVALDYASSQEARKLVATLHGEVGIFKIGLELIYGDGLPFARNLIDSGFQVFLDAKLLDIPNTVERAVDSACQLGAAFLTVHGTDRKTLDAAVRGRGSHETKLLAITVLTSVDTSDLVEQGIERSLEELILRRARLAKEAGFDGVVASALEAKALREQLGPDFLIVTPGIRPAGTHAGDQQRIATPASAIASGADYLVIGRPITAAPDPRRATEQIIREIEDALLV